MRGKLSYLTPGGPNLKEWPEYELISAFYGDKTAERSGISLMRHIDEGIDILQVIGASLSSMKAWCLHPILQEDAEVDLPTAGPRAITLAREYGRVANAYLSTDTISSPDEIDLSSHEEVQQMLVADKIQNRKDFERYHEGAHPRSAELKEYFINWFARLGISEEMYAEICSKIANR